MSEPPAPPPAAPAATTPVTTTATTATVSEVKNPNDGKKTDQNDIFSLKVKRDYVLDKRPPALGDLPPEAVPVDNGGGDDRDRGGKRNKKKKNKKRPRDPRTPNSEKVCLSVLRGDTCPYGDTCKFSHNLQEYLKTRPEDLTFLEDGCPNFRDTGFCLFGAMCRFGSSHIIKATGENLRMEDVVAPPPVMNNLPKEILLQLRKRKYPFKQKRFDEKSKNNQQKDKDGNDAKKEATNGGDSGLAAKEGESKDNGDTSGGYKKIETTDSGFADAAASAEKETTEAGEHFKTIVDPFRPSLASSKYNNSTPFPSKTKKIIDFSNKVYVAPLTTVGNLPFRRIMKKFGADITCGEMALAGNLIDGKPSEWALLKRHPEEDVFGVQIASGYPDQFARISEVIESNMEVDFIDMNLGCPLDIVCNKGAGSALMLRDKKLKGILEGVTSTVSCPVTVKMRTGWATEKPFAHQLVNKIQSWGIDGVAAVMVSRPLSTGEKY